MQSSIQQPNQSMAYQQGDLVWAQYPLTDKVDKLKKRPVLILSNTLSNKLDNDFIVIPITKTIREEVFSLTITPEDVVGDLPVMSELRCNKPFTVRNSLLHELIGRLNAQKISHAIQLLHDSVWLDKTPDSSTFF
jgi:mRNA-degrading endonuclease toxin of MazEF toxin-antitoxin module